MTSAFLALTRVVLLGWWGAQSSAAVGRRWDQFTPGELHGQQLRKRAWDPSTMPSAKGRRPFVYSRQGRRLNRMPRSAR